MLIIICESTDEILNFHINFYTLIIAYHSHNLKFTCSRIIYTFFLKILTILFTYYLRTSNKILQVLLFVSPVFLIFFRNMLTFWCFNFPLVLNFKFSKMICCSGATTKIIISGKTCFYRSNKKPFSYILFSNFHDSWSPVGTNSRKNSSFQFWFQ